VGDFMATHPGGGKLIEDLLGKSIDEEYEEVEHTTSARRALMDLKVIGIIVKKKTDQSKNEGPTKRGGMTGLDGFQLDQKLNEKYKFDYDKGMVYQVFC